MLSAFTTAAVAEAKAIASDGKFGPKDYLEFLELLPALLADQEQRACAGPRPAVVCIGPGRHPDAAKRIAALIARLDEALGYRPGAVILFCPERPTWVRKQNFDA